MSDLEPRGNGAGHGGPQRGYSWPPFEHGHELSTLHGARSPRRVDPVAQALAEWVVGLDGLEHLREPRFAAAVAGWARAEAVVLLLADYCAQMAVDAATVPAKKGAASSPLEILRQWESTAATQRSRLGLDPMSAAKLMRELTETSAAARFAGLDAVREQGRAARERRLNAIDVAPDDQGGTG